MVISKTIVILLYFFNLIGCTVSNGCSIHIYKHIKKDVYLTSYIKCFFLADTCHTITLLEKILDLIKVPFKKRLAYELFPNAFAVEKHDQSLNLLMISYFT